jgi:hypothetical protein
VASMSGIGTAHMMPRGELNNFCSDLCTIDPWRM